MVEELFFRCNGWGALSQMQWLRSFKFSSVAMVEELFLSCNGWLRSSSSDAMVDWRALPQLPWLIEELFLSCNGWGALLRMQWLRSSSSDTMVDWRALPQLQWLIEEHFLSCNGWLRSSSVAMVELWISLSCNGWGALLRMQWLRSSSSDAMVDWGALPQLQWLIMELLPAKKCHYWYYATVVPLSPLAERVAKWELDHDT